MNIQQENVVPPKAAPGAQLLARQPLSPLGRIALWSFLVGGMGSLGGVIALTITNGAPSRDIVILMVSTLLCLALLVTRLRWATLATALIGTFNLYLVLTEPFVVESLADPKGPNGGFGHFIGDVFVIAITIIALAASIGATLQTYRGGSRGYPGWFTLVLCGSLGLVIGASFIGALAQPPGSGANAGVTFTNGVPTVHMSPGNFTVSEVTISKGSRLLLADDTSEQHVLTNGTWRNNEPVLQREPGAPLVNKLSFSGNSVAIGPFNVAGTYHLLCLLHRGMNLTITVQ